MDIYDFLTTLGKNIIDDIAVGKARKVATPKDITFVEDTEPEFACDAHGANKASASSWAVEMNSQKKQHSNASGWDYANKHDHVVERWGTTKKNAEDDGWTADQFSGGWDVAKKGKHSMSKQNVAFDDGWDTDGWGNCQSGGEKVHMSGGWDCNAPSKDVAKDDDGWGVTQIMGKAAHSDDGWRNTDVGKAVDSDDGWGRNPDVGKAAHSDDGWGCTPNVGKAAHSDDGWCNTDVGKAVHSDDGWGRNTDVGKDVHLDDGWGCNTNVGKAVFSDDGWGCNTDVGKAAHSLDGWGPSTVGGELSGAGWDSKCNEKRKTKTSGSGWGANEGAAIRQSCFSHGDKHHFNERRTGRFGPSGSKMGPVGSGRGRGFVKTSNNLKPCKLSGLIGEDRSAKKCKHTDISDAGGNDQGDDVQKSWSSDQCNDGWGSPQPVANDGWGPSGNEDVHLFRSSTKTSRILCGKGQIDDGSSKAAVHSWNGLEDENAGWGGAELSPNGQSPTRNDGWERSPNDTWKQSGNDEMKNASKDDDCGEALGNNGGNRNDTWSSFQQPSYCEQKSGVSGQYNNGRGFPKNTLSGGSGGNKEGANLFKKSLKGGRRSWWKGQTDDGWGSSKAAGNGWNELENESASLYSDWSAPKQSPTSQKPTSSTGWDGSENGWGKPKDCLHDGWNQSGCGSRSASKQTQNDGWGEASGNNEGNDGWGSCEQSSKSAEHIYCDYDWGSFKKPWDGEKNNGWGSSGKYRGDNSWKSCKQSSDDGWEVPSQPTTAGENADSDTANGDGRAKVKASFASEDGWGGSINQNDGNGWGCNRTAFNKSNSGSKQGAKRERHNGTNKSGMRKENFTPGSPTGQNRSGHSHQMKDLMSLPELSEVSELYKMMNRILHHSDYKDGDRLTMEDEKEVLDKVLVHHPEKDAKLAGLEYLMINTHPDYNARCFFVVHTDGSQTDFSYWKCLKNLIQIKYPELAAKSFSVA